MATDAGGTRPLTALVAGNGQSSVSYQLPAGLLQYVQSIVATVDTSSSGDVAPLLTIRDDANIVVADKQQNQAIDAGGSGRATWALRLTDDARPLSLPSMHGAYSGGLGPVTSGSTLTLDFRHSFAISDPSVFTYLTDADGYPVSIGLEKPGLYLVFASVTWTTTGFTGLVSATVEDAGGFFQSGRVPVPALSPNLNTNVEVSVINVFPRYHYANLVASQASGVDRTPGEGTLKIVKLS